MKSSGNFSRLWTKAPQDLVFGRSTTALPTRLITSGRSIEKKLLAAAATCGWTSGSLQLFEDVVKLMRDTGMRNRRELYRIRIENIDWQTRSIFLPDSKTPEGRRTVPMSERVFEISRRRCCDSQGVEKKEGWVFPARRKRAKLPYLTSIAHISRKLAKRQACRKTWFSIAGVTILER